MLTIEYNNKGRFRLTPTTMDENNFLIELFSNQAYNNGEGVTYARNGNEPAWIIDEKYIDMLNKDLLPIKKCISLHSSVVEWKNKRNNPIRNNDGTKKEPLKIRCGVVNSRILKGDYEIPNKELDEKCRYFWKPAVRQQRFKDKRWDGYLHLYKSRFHEFPTGLLNEVTSLLEEKSIPVVVEYEYDQKPLPEFKWSIDDGIIPDPDQIEAVDACIKGLRGICKAPTGKPLPFSEETC